MRYPATQRKESRASILSVASRQFRAKGSEGVRVSDVMQEAGMTVGGFYKHFASKGQLLQEAVKEALKTLSAQLEESVRGLPRHEALARVIATYLSEDHVQNPDLGCALAAMGSELARLPPNMKRAMNDALDAYAEQLDFLMPGKTPEERRAAFHVLFPSMAGCVMVARAHRSRMRQTQILNAGRAFFVQAFCGSNLPVLMEKTQ